MNKTWRKTLSVGVVLAISLAGCASKQAETKPTKPTKAAKPTQVASSPKQGGEQKALAEKKKLGTWEGDPPAFPLKGNEHTKDGAANVAAYWISATDYAIFTGNTEPMEKVTSTDQPAFRTIRAISESFKETGRYFGKPLKFALDIQELVSEDTFDNQFEVYEPQRMTEKGEKIPEKHGLIKVRTKWVGAKWKVLEVGAKDDAE
ncbi:MAG: DUF6318 family protein [Actinomycetaceae bacterium]|nr:DUF6318 family protein [Actinomycetaceae bacterium]